MVSRVDLLRTVTPGVDGAEETNGAHHERASAPVTRVMSKDVPLVSADDPLSHLINVVVSTRLNRAVVVDADRKPLGVVSDAELIERVTPDARPGLITAMMRRLPLLQGSKETQAALQHARGRVAKDFMRREFAVVSSDATIAEALEKMLDDQRKIGIVIDPDGKLLGMVDRRDLLSALV